MKDEQHTLHIYIHNLTRAQAVAIEDMLAVWHQAGSLGCSRWTSFFADGDGNFRPTCVVNGHIAHHQQHVHPGKFWTNGTPWHGDYKIDFDAIAWKLREEDEQSARPNVGAAMNESERVAPARLPSVPSMEQPTSAGAVDPSDPNTGTPSTRV